MTEPALVSVVIPSHNYGHFVAQAVDSVLAQSYPSVEIIVVDDGSTDDTRERLAGYGDRIRYLAQPNRGVCASRNTGIRAALGPYLALLDSDDVWHPDKLREQMPVFEAHPGAGLVSTTAYFINDTGTTTTAPMAGEGSPTSQEYEIEDLLTFSPFCPSSVVIPRSVLGEIGDFDPSLSGAGDLDLWLRIAARYPVIRLNRPLTGYRVHPDNMSTRADLMFLDHQRVLAKAFCSIPKLVHNPVLRRRAKARMYRDAAWMRYCSGRRWGALRDLGRSVLCCPAALSGASGHRRRLERLKIFFRILRNPGG